MKGIENVVGCNNSSDAEIKIEVFSDESPVLSPSPANKPVRSNLLDVMRRDVSGADIIINDETLIETLNLVMKLLRSIAHATELMSVVGNLIEILSH